MLGGLTIRNFRTLAVLVAAAASLVPAAAAQAAPKPSAEILGTVAMAPGGESATVRARYTCTQPTHLWVSAKQMADGRRDPAVEQEGSSGYADAWLQSHPASLECDGRSHVQAFTIDKTEVVPWSPEPVGFGVLGKGQAWVQFCMTTEDGGLVYPARWTAVV